MTLSSSAFESRLILNLYRRIENIYKKKGKSTIQISENCMKKHGWCYGVACHAYSFCNYLVSDESTQMAIINWLLFVKKPENFSLFFYGEQRQNIFPRLPYESKLSIIGQFLFSRKILRFSLFFLKQKTKEVDIDLKICMLNEPMKYLLPMNIL